MKRKNNDQVDLIINNNILFILYSHLIINNLSISFNLICFEFFIADFSVAGLKYFVYVSQHERWWYWSHLLRGLFLLLFFFSSLSRSIRSDGREIKQRALVTGQPTKLNWNATYVCKRVSGFQSNMRNNSQLRNSFYPTRFETASKYDRISLHT